MATCKFNVGDMVIGNDTNRYGITKKGWIGKVTAVRESSIQVYGNSLSDKMHFWVDPKYFDHYTEAKVEEKIVITHDGKTTTATKYCADGSKVTATARCAPEDDFDFNVGAELAMERLMEKTNPVEWRVVNRNPRVGDYVRLKTNGMYHWNKPGDILKVDVVKHGTLVAVYGKNHIRPTDDQDFLWNYTGNEYEVVEKADTVTVGGFKVGDRVNYNGHNGVVICIKSSKTTETPIGVEFDTWCGASHRCNSFPLADGKCGTTDRCKWCEPELLKHGEAKSEPVELWNGRVVCTQKGKCVGFTQGKIYKVENGKLIDDQGEKRPMLTKHYISTPEDLTATDGYFAKWDDKFIPIVE